MSKIQKDHLDRAAFVYVRQSSPAQVEQNLESQRRQYGLVERAKTLGWRDIRVIDEDLGRSGSGCVERRGFETLLSEVFSNSGPGVKLSVNFPAEPTVLSAFGRWNALRMVAPGDFGRSMCEARFTLSSIARPRTISPSPRPGRDVFSRPSAGTRFAVKLVASQFLALTSRTLCHQPTCDAG